jgi:predicted O-methyltransferase YrrM
MQKEAKMKKIEEPKIDSNLIDEVARGFQISQVLLTGMKFCLFDRLKEEKTAIEITEEIQANPVIIEKLLNVLASLQLISKKNKKYINTEIAQTYLVKDSPFYQGNLLNLIAQGNNIWSNLDKALKGENTPKRPNGQRDKVFDKSFILAMAEGGIRGPLQKTIKTVSVHDVFNNAKTLLDIGGGHGLYAIGFAQKNPDLKVTVFDLPPVVEVAKDFIEQYGIHDRINTQAGDYMKDDLGGKYDIIFASDTFYHPKETLQNLLEKIYHSLNDNGFLISKHWVVNEDRTEKLTAVFWDLWLSLLEHPHYVYTASEYTELFKEHNLLITEIIDISTPPDPSVIILAKKEA